MSESVIVGLDIDNVSDLKETLNGAMDVMFDYIIIPLVHQRNERDLTGVERNVPLTRSDLVLTAQSWSSYVVGKISPWLNFDSKVEKIRLNSRMAFKQEIAWASHLSLTAILLPYPEWDCANYASCVLSTLLNISGSALWVEVPLISPKKMMLLNQQDEEVQLSKEWDSWECWNKMRTLCMVR